MSPLTESWTTGMSALGKMWTRMLHAPWSMPQLSSQLKSLEREGIVSRTVYAEVPLRVEYSLTEIGRKFESVLASIEAWGYDYIDFLHANRPTAS